jgi:hypothetical protein
LGLSAQKARTAFKSGWPSSRVFASRASTSLSRSPTLKRRTARSSWNDTAPVAMLPSFFRLLHSV